MAYQGRDTERTAQRSCRGSPPHPTPRHSGASRGLEREGNSAAGRGSATGRQVGDLHLGMETKVGGSGTQTMDVSQEGCGGEAACAHPRRALCLTLPGARQHLQLHRSPWPSSGDRDEANYSQDSANPAGVKAEGLPQVSSVRPQRHGSIRALRAVGLAHHDSEPP